MCHGMPPAYTMTVGGATLWTESSIDAASLRGLAAADRPRLAGDIRPFEAHRDGRLPGARSIPLTSLTARRGEVPADALVVLHGAAGHANVALEGGFDAWQAQRYGVER